MAPTKTRPLLWLLPALAAAQSSCHKNKKGVRCNNRTGRDRRCWADEKCGGGAAEPVVPTFAALDRCRRPRCAACGFTSTIADERRYRSKYTRRFWTSADFDVFRRRGVSVHIDVEGRGGPAKHPALTTDAALLHMAHWSTADVFLAGHSSFSSIPALLNPNCVMAPMYTPNSAKRACVARLARARAAELSRA